MLFGPREKLQPILQPKSRAAQQWKKEKNQLKKTARGPKEIFNMN
jgi:hypothetical protein